MCQAVGWLVYARHYPRLDVEWGRVTLILALTLFSSTVLWLFYIAFEPYVRRFWPELLIGWTRLLSGRVRDPLVGRDVLVGAVAGTIAALLIASRDLAPRLLGRPLPAPVLPLSLILQGTRYAAAAALEVVPRAFRHALECVCVVVFLKILVRRTWLVLLISTVAILPIAMNGTFAGEQLAIELTIAVVGIASCFPCCCGSGSSR